MIDFEHVNGVVPDQDEAPPSMPADPLVALVPFLAFDDLFTPEPDAKLIVPALGLSPGAPSGLWGQGYVGKTIVALSAGLCIASGRPLWGLYGVKKGRWLHLDHEQGRRHTKSRIARLVAAMGIDRDDLRGQLEIAVYPRLNLTTDGAEDLYKRLFEGFDLVTIDALKGVTPSIDENSSVVRDYLDKLGRASEATGAHVMLIHHAGKTPMQGTRIRKEAGRGSSAIFDAHSTVLVLTGKKGEPIHVSHEKDRELGYTLPDFGLTIEDVEIGGNPKGGLRVVHLEREQLSPEQQGRTLDVLVDRVLEGEAGKARRSPEPKPGDAFGKLVAVESARRDGRGRLRWLFECECGRQVTWQVSTVTYNLRKLGWCYCPDCYADAGGWSGIAATMEQRLPEPTHETENHRDAAHVARPPRTKSHRAISHRAQVRESASRSESCADAGGESCPKG